LLSIFWPAHQLAPAIVDIKLHVKLRAYLKKADQLSGYRANMAICFPMAFASVIN
jgi:hypothetical protein